RAHVLLARRAGGARAAADPGKHRGLLTDVRALRLRPHALDDAGNLVPEGERQAAPGGHIEALVRSEHEITVLQMDVRVAHAAPAYPDDDLAADRLRHLGNGFAQWAGVSGERLADEFRHVSTSAALCADARRCRQRAREPDKALD